MTKIMLITLVLALTSCTQPGTVTTPSTPTPAAIPNQQTADLGNWSVCTPALNVRSGPGLEYPILTGIFAGEPVTVYETIGGWGRIAPHAERWIWTGYLCSQSEMEHPHESK